MHLILVLAAATPTPSPYPTGLHRAAEASPIYQVLAVVSIVLAVLAGVLGYRIIRGGKGL